MNKKSKIIIAILLIIIIILSILLFNKNNNIVKVYEEKEQLLTEDSAYISMKDHFAEMSKLEAVIETEDNWKLWAQKAQIEIENYANINELLADTQAVTTLSNSQEAVDYMMTSKDTNNCIRQKIIDNNDAMVTILKSSYAKSKILQDDEWRQMITTNRESLINAIISANIATKISLSSSYTPPIDLSYPSASATDTKSLQANDLILQYSCSASQNGVVLTYLVINSYLYVDDTCILSSSNRNSTGSTYYNISTSASAINKNSYIVRGNTLKVHATTNALYSGNSTNASASLRANATVYVLR